jgi:hypothetical protein
MTHPREWPNAAANARDKSAEAALCGIRALRPLIMGQQFDRTEQLRRIAVALDSLQTIARHMEFVGAQTRPE